MTLRPLSLIGSWHAHVYFDASSREEAWALREIINVELSSRMEMGRFHEKPVGPHPMWSYQLAFPVASFPDVVSWLALNRGTLLANPNQPDATATAFYKVPTTNHYARLIHASTTGGAGYAFPYDDVHADGYNTEGRVVDQHPTRLRVQVG